MTLKKHISTLALASILGLTLAHPGVKRTRRSQTAWR